MCVFIHFKPKIFFHCSANPNKKIMTLCKDEKLLIKKSNKRKKLAPFHCLIPGNSEEVVEGKNRKRIFNIGIKV